MCKDKCSTRLENERLKQENSDMLDLLVSLSNVLLKNNQKEINDREAISQIIDLMHQFSENQ